VAIFVVDRRALMKLDQDALRRKCLRLSRDWEARGCPPEDHMPAWMVVARAALQAELDRRGEQLRLF
jgi:hypothetical protein